MPFRIFAALLAACMLCMGYSPASASGDPAARHIDVASGRHPSMCSDNRGRLHVAYEGYTRGARVPDIYYTRSSDQGRHWSSPRNISKTPGFSGTPAIAVDKDGAVTVVWCDTSSGSESPDIYSSHSKDGGNTWSAAVDVSNTPGRSSQPAVATGPDNAVHVVWVDTSADSESPEIFYAKSIDGEGFTRPVDVSLTPGVSSEPSVTVTAEGTVYVAWLDTSSQKSASEAPHPDIYYVRTTKNGTWTGAANMSNTKGISAHPSIAAGPRGKVYLTWADNTLNAKATDVFFSVSSDGGTFFEPLNISKTTGVSGVPTATTDSTGRVVVVWTDTTHGSTSPDIWGAWSRDLADKFSKSVNLSATPGVSKWPSVALNNDVMYVIWEEILNGHSILKLISISFK